MLLEIALRARTHAHTESGWRAQHTRFGLETQDASDVECRLVVASAHEVYLERMQLNELWQPVRLVSQAARGALEL